MSTQQGATEEEAEATLITHMLKKFENTELERCSVETADVADDPDFEE